VFQVRIHGRGGQGVVTAAELLSVAAFDEGQYAQAFPSFGSERTGAPVVSYCRMDKSPIRTREPVNAPNALIIQDATLIHQVDLFSGLAPGGYVVINTSRSLLELGLEDALAGQLTSHVTCCPATEIATLHIGRAVPNVVLLGALAGLTGVVSLTGVTKAVTERFPGELGERNATAASKAYAYMQEHYAEICVESQERVYAPAT
jgi:pyruvate ferredoxin oxidoreductase gamma subunit